jgi:hypothetical protein
MTCNSRRHHCRFSFRAQMCKPRRLSTGACDPVYFSERLEVPPNGPLCETRPFKGDSSASTPVLLVLGRTAKLYWCDVVVRVPLTIVLV